MAGLYRNIIGKMVAPTSSTKENNTLRLEDDLKVTSPELLRAVVTRRLLRGFGAIFRSSAGDAKSFGISHTVMQIGAFLSHAWTTPAWLKTVGLLFYYNVRRSVIAAMIVEVLAYVAQAATGGNIFVKVVCIWLCPVYP